MKGERQKFFFTLEFGPVAVILSFLCIKRVNNLIVLDYKLPVDIRYAKISFRIIL